MMSLFSFCDLLLFKISLFFFFFFMIFFFNLNYKISSIEIFQNNGILKTESLFLNSKPQKFNKYFSMMLIFSMVMMFFFNFLGVMAYIFPLTSQVSMVFSTALLFWLSFMIFTTTLNSQKMFYHFIPMGCPIYLSWFLFLIEVSSQIIRPITLTIRIVANILSGHLLMVLLFKLLMLVGEFFILYIFLNLIEMFVSLIQSYIFFTMLSLYYAEI